VDATLRPFNSTRFERPVTFTWLVAARGSTKLAFIGNKGGASIHCSGSTSSGVAPRSLGDATPDGAVGMPLGSIPLISMVEAPLIAYERSSTTRLPGCRDIHTSLATPATPNAGAADSREAACEGGRGYERPHVRGARDERAICSLPLVRPDTEWTSELWLPPRSCNDDHFTSSASGEMSTPFT
jgi:hypothetical protein